MFPLVPVVLTTAEATQLFIAGVTAGTTAAAVVKKKNGKGDKNEIKI